MKTKKSILQKIKAFFIHVVMRSSLFKKGDLHIYDCKCGRKIEVWTNVYDNANSGVGVCKCGATIWIN